MDSEKYNKMLYKLFLKGIITEEKMVEKMEERKKSTKFEEDVDKAIFEVMKEGYIHKTMERIWKGKKDK